MARYLCALVTVPQATNAEAGHVRLGADICTIMVRV